MQTRRDAAIVRVHYDPQTFMRQRTGGISRLFTDLIATFDADPSLGVEPDLTFRWSNNQHAAMDLAHRGMRATPQWLPRGAIYAPWWLRGGGDMSGCDLVHHTYYSERFLGVPGRAKQATTVYDMIPELFADSGIHTGSHLQKLRYVQECDLVVCISESTRRDLETIFGPVSGEVRVIPLGVQPGFSPNHPPLPGLPSEYLLYVGARRGYKDFSLLPVALQELREQGLDVPLVVVGKPLTDQERAQIASHGVTGCIAHLALDDAQLKQAYAHCSLLVQTSSYEGFGLPPLEAMASGAPVVVAHASSMPEVGGTVAQYFEAGNPESLAETISSVLTSEGLSDDLRRRGIDRAREFTIRTMAERTAAAYRDVLDS